MSSTDPEDGTRCDQRLTQPDTGLGPCESGHVVTSVEAIALETGPDLIRQGNQEVGTCVERKHRQKHANGTRVEQNFVATFHDFTPLAQSCCG